MTDQEIIDGAVEVHSAGQQIEDLQARVIANAWHGGEGSALYSFASCGAITVEELTCEIRSELAVSSRPELEALLAYVTAHGERGPQAGWSELNW